VPPARARPLDSLPAGRLAQVFRHPSQTEDRVESYERLEFLGDSVLGFVVARALYDRFPEFSEGQLSKIRAHVVSRRSCAVVAAELGLDRRLEESGEIPDDLRRSSNVLAALMEAVLAALYLERGLDELAGPVVEAFEPRIEEALTESVDQKTTLQEELAKRGQRVEYVTLGTDGPPHDRTFECAALVDGEQVGTGIGRTKKDAEQEAARMALDRLGLPAVEHP
jgi:ribonuclease III